MSEPTTDRTQVQTHAPSISRDALQGFPVIPGYEITNELGRGGMGIVYQAKQQALGRVVAIKHIQKNDGLHQARFLAEGQIIAALKHPNVVEVHDFGESNTGPFIAMEHLPGGTFGARLRAEPKLAPRESAELIAQIAAGVGAAHANQIVHRDLKPGNVLLDAHGVPKVTDFGLAKRTDSDLTRTHEAAGTPSYMAPEQARAMKFVGPPADVWSLGVMLYESLTGRKPFVADTDAALLVSIQTEHPPTLRTLSKTIPPDLETICLKCLEKEPDRRYATAEELSADLRRWLEGSPIVARRATPVERAMLWVRRKPAVAASWALGLLVVVLGTFAATAGALWQKAEYEKAVAEGLKGEAEEARDRAEDEKRKAEGLKGEAEEARDWAQNEKRKADLAREYAVELRDIAQKEAKQLAMKLFERTTSPPTPSRMDDSSSAMMEPMPMTSKPVTATDDRKAPVPIERKPEERSASIATTEGPPPPIENKSERNTARQNDLDAIRQADQLSLEYIRFRKVFLGSMVFDASWLSDARGTINSLQTRMPRSHPDFPDVIAYRALITLNRFHFSRPFGDLKQGGVAESTRDREWSGMIKDAEDALVLEKNNPIAAQVLSYAYYGMFNQSTSYIPPISFQRKFDLGKKQHKPVVQKVIGYLKDATEGPRTEKVTELPTLLAFLRLRSQFQFTAGYTFAKRGEPTSEVRALLMDAARSAEQTIKLRPEKKIADHTVYGRILEDLAWFGLESPAETYGKSIEMSRAGTAIAPTTALERMEVVRGRMDMARAIVRAVQLGHFPSARLSDADAAWTAMDAAIEVLPEAERGQATPIQAEAAYWKAMRMLVAGRAMDAVAAFAAAAENLRVNDSNHYVPALVHRAEAILSGTEGREAVAEILVAVEAAADNAFTADYIKALKAVAEGDLEAAKVQFHSAYRKIRSQWQKNELVLDEPFALRCLAYELTRIRNLKAEERTERKEMLKSLQSAFAWTMTAADKTLVSDVLAK
jgi:eukaryotic-like serine/threonine-protein kinase